MGKWWEARYLLADSSSVANTLRISCRYGVGGLVHQRGEHLVGGREAERLARPTVEPGGDRVELGLREHRQVGALGQVLAQQAVSVLVGPALPRRMRVGEVDAQARERGQLPMAGHLLAVGQGEAQRCRHRQQAKPSRAVAAVASVSLISLRLDQRT